ncbi:MAG: SMC-Scp complex subunit ScpB [Vulcanimicrobiaceae bacterium]
MQVEETIAQSESSPPGPSGAELQHLIEALLFVASEPLSIKELSKLTRASEIEVATMLQQIEADFSGRGLVVREIGGGYRFASAPSARSTVEAYLLPPRTNLSTPALETLAIIAYLQPVTKSEIEAIRGVSAESVVSTLLDRRLVIEAGRKDVVGRPVLYKTSADFLDSFGLRSLEDLPDMELEPGQPLALDLLATAVTANVPPAGSENPG